MKKAGTASKGDCDNVRMHLAKIEGKVNTLIITSVDESFYCIDEGVKGEGYLCDKQCDGCKRL